MNLKDWLSLGMGNFKLQGKTRCIPINDYSAWEKYDNETSKDWSNPYYGCNITNYIIEPLLEAFYFQALKDTSKALPIAINSFVAHKAKSKTLIGGIGRLPEMLGERIELRTNTSVQNISIENDAVVVRADKKTFKADKAILATPAPISRKLYKNPSILENKLLNTEYSSTLNVAIALKNKSSQPSSLKDIYGVWIPKAERNMIAAFTIESNKNVDRATLGDLVNVMLSGNSGKAMIEKKEQEILSVIFPELEKYIPEISKNVAFTKVYRWLNAEPMSPVGRCSDIKNYRETIQERNRVILAGDYLGMPFTEGAAETGLWAATIARRLG